MKHSLSPLKSSALAAALMPLAMAPALAAEGQPAARQIEEILVSARRTQEDAQSVPVTMHAFGTEGMREKSLVLLKDLMYTVPGLYMGGAGPQENAIYSIRGQGRPVAGAGQPGVLTYFADVPMPTFASSVPAYDIASVQVLKGPQGTLFGRNTTGGAILTYPKQPTYDFGGYLDTSFGNHDLNTYEGVLNVPLVDQKLALRVATYFDRRDGLIENVGNGPDLDDLHSDNLRLSLLWEPWDGVKNNLIYEYRKQRQTGSAPRIVETTEALNIYGPAIAAIAQFGADRQAALGPWKVDYGDYEPLSDVDVEGIYNRTDIEFGQVTFTNIFGYREQEWRNEVRTDGFPGYISQFGNTVGFIIAHNVYTNRQLSNEVQLKGTLFNDKVDWLVGGFYLKDEPIGPYGSDLDFFFSTAGRFSYALNEQDSRALFANASIDLSNVLEGLKLNVGYRYTWDDYATCAGAGENAAPYGIGRGDCPDDPRLVPSTVADLKTDSSADTWIVGLDYQVNEDLFLYASSRKGYRAGGINTPAFGQGLKPVQFFEPDEVIDFELGMRSDWQLGDMQARLNVAYFYAMSKDVQYTLNGVQTPPTCNPANPVPPASPDGDCNPANDPNLTVLLINAGDTITKGGELEATLMPTDRLSLGINATLVEQKTDDFSPDPSVAWKFTDGAEIPFYYQPELSYSANLRYILPFDSSWGEVVFNADYFWSDSLEFTGYETDDYALVNLRLDWNSVVGQPFDLGVFVRNLTDEDAVISSSLSTATMPIRSVLYNDPRVYGVTFRYRFGANAN
jgi:iron complex outermembrane receptor protein